MTNDYLVSEKEKIGRDKVLSVFGNKIDFTCSTAKYDSWDMSAVTYSNVDLTDKNIFIEVKDRECKSTAYDTVFLEVGKLEKLQSLSKFYNADIFYMCTYTDGYMYVFNLKNIKLMDVYFKTIKTEAETYTDKKVMVDKLFIELPIKLGKQIKLKN